MSKYDAKAYWSRSENEKKNNKNSVSTKTNDTSYDAKTFWDRSEYQKSINFDTLSSDLTSLTKTLNSVYNGWQTKETMSNTLSSVQSMYDRLGKYQEYQKQYGGADLSEIQSSLKATIDGWDSLSRDYRKYTSADEYNKVVKNAKAQTEKMNTADIGTLDKEISSLRGAYEKASEYQKTLDKYKSMERTAKSRATNLNGVEFPETKKAESELNSYLKSVGYNSLDELQKALGEKEVFKTNAERMQNLISLSSVGDKESENYDKDYDKYVNIGMNIPTDEIGTSKRRRAVGKGRPANTPKVNDDLREAALAGERRRNGETSSDSSSYYDKGAIYDLMTDEEFKDFYYYSGKDKEDGGNRTQEYLDSIADSLNSRRGEKIAKMVEEKPWGELGFSIEAGLDQWASGIKANFSDKDYIPSSPIQNASGIVRDDVEYEHGKIARTMYDLGVTGANQLPSIYVSTMLGAIAPVGLVGASAKVASGIAKGAGLATMGISARGNAYQEMLNLGYNKDQANTYANLVGASEVGLQALLGGIGKLGGTSGKIAKMVEGIDNGFARFAIQWGGSIASEATEEGLQEVLNPLFTNIAAGYDTGAEVDWSEVAYSALLGGLMGAGFGAVELGPSAIAEHRYNKGMGQTIKANERVSDLFDIANNPEVASAYETYTRYANKGVTAENISDVQLGRLYSMAKTDAVETLESKKSTEEQKTEALKTLAQLSTVKSENTLKKEAKKDFNVGEETKVTKSGDAIDIKGLKVKGNEVTVATENGEISVDDVTLTQNDAELVVLAKGIAKTDGEDVANLFISQYDGKTNPEAYSNAFNLTMAYSKNNFTYDTILNKKGVLTTEQVKSIYEETRIKADKARMDEIKKLNKQMADKGFYKGYIDESVIDYNNTSAEGKVNWNDLTARQRQAITFIKGFAQATGMNLEFVANNPKYNGKYEREKNTLTINLDKGGFDAINNLQETIIPTMSHETTHWMREKSPELWRNLNEIVFSTLTEHYNSNTEQAIKDKIALLDRLDPRVKHTEEDAKGRTITEEDLIRAEMNRKGKSEDVSREEIIARACEDMLKMSEQGRKIFFSLSEAEQKTLVGKIKSLINDLLNWVNDLLNSYEATSTEARIMREYKEQLQKASKVWDEMLKKSVEANQSLEKSGAYEHKKSTSEGDVLYDEKDYSYWLDRIETISDEKALETKSKITYLRVSDTTPKILRKYGANDLPVIMRFDAMYLAQRDSGVLKGHYHNLGKEVMANLMEYLSNPDVILKTVADDGKTKLAVLISIPVKSGEALASVEINTLKDRGSGDELYNLVVTFFDFKENYLKNLFKKYGAEIKYKKETLSQDNPKLHKWLGTIKESVPKDSILNSDKNVKEKVSNETIDGYAKANEMQIEINQLTEQIRQMESSDDFEAIMGVIKNDVEKGIAEYNKWLKESGYSEIREKRDALQNELNQLRKDLQESSKQKALDEEQKAIEKSGLSEADYFRKQAVKEFGYTPYFYDAGYITPNGKMLNFSGEKGKHYGSRGQDHRAIGIVYANVEGSKAMVKFMGEGNIRIMAESPGLDISSSVVPTTEQYATIRNFVREYANKEYFNIDLTDAEGHTIGNYEYEGKISAERVVNDIKYFFENGTTREQSSISQFLYSEKNTDISTQINTSMTMDEAKQMIQRAFVIGGIYEWYDREYKNGDEWLRGVGVGEVALNIENEYTLTEKYLNKLQGYIDGDFYVEDILEAYLNGTLVGKEKQKAKRLDISKEYRINDERFYSPQRIKDAKKLLSVATKRMTEKNRKEVSDARAKVLIFAHNKGASELLGMTQAELNKKLRAWSNYSAKARDISKRFNNGVADSNKWTGIENCSWLYKGTVTTKDLESLVKSVKGASSDYEKFYIARTMLALDTHIDWSWLSFEFDTYNEVNKGKTFSVSKCLGYYTNESRKIVVTHDKPHTVAHEMGHALDYQWARDLGFNYEALTEVSRHTERITDAETKQFFENFRIFIDSLTDNGDIRSEYTQNPKEVFARFVARFVQWVENTGTGRNSYNTETSYYNDKFTASHYIEFVKLLQEKAMLDAKKMEMETNEDILYSEKEQGIYDLMGEAERIKKENEKFKAEVERLNERLKIERQVTHGNYFNENQLGAVAGHLRNISKSNMDKVELMKSLKDVYSFIAHSENLTWEEVFEKCYNVADAMIAEAKPVTIVDDYSKYLLREIRNTRISLDETQKKEAQYHFGKNWNRHFMGKVIISDTGIDIDSKWQEWSNTYPDIFDADTNSGDMISELYDIIGSLRDASETIDEYSVEEQKRWLANEIYNQYWNVSPIRTTADKYDKQIKRLNFEHRRAMSELRDDYNTRLKEQHKVDKEKQKKLITEIRERKNKEIALAKEHGREMLGKYKENANKKTLIQRITANSLSLKKSLEKNSKDDHIHELLKGPVIKLLNAIDLSSKRMLENGEPTIKDITFKDAFASVQAMLKDAGNNVEGLEDLYGHDLAEQMKMLSKAAENLVGDNHYVINAMSVKELQALDKLVRYMRSTVNRFNKFHVTQHNAGVQALGIETTEDVDSAKKIYKDHKKHFDKLKTKTYWNQLNPYYAFKNLGESAMKVFKAFMDGQDKVAFLSKEAIDFAESVYTDKDYKKWEKTFFDFEIKQPSGKVAKFTMNVPQIMSLYCVAKQQDAKNHLLHGNQVGDDIGKGRGITLVETDKTEAVRTNILLTEADLNNILAKLNDTDKVGKAKEVADKLQEFMCTRGAELGNEISVARWGIKSFGIENYFPIKVSDGAVPDKGETPGVQGNPLVALLNMSFTHSRNQFASQSIEIGDIFDVFSNHMASMIQYNAMALPVLDMYKWMNCKFDNEFGEEISVKTSIKNTFGDYAWGYFNTFLQDVNGTTKNDTRDNLGVKFFKNAKVAKVAANIRVALLQFTSYIRAGAVMDNKYLLRALGHRPKSKKAKEHCGIALWKSLGYYDTDITTPLADKIKHSTTWKDKTIEWSLKGAEKADEITWGFLWNACELEVRDTRKDLKVGSEEFYKEIGTRLREVVYRTQVVDSQLTRSQMMRSKSGWDKTLTTFASESTLSFNLITDLFVSYKLDSRRMGKEAAKQKHGKYIRKAITAYVVTNVVTTLIASMFDAFRDYNEEDKDEEYITKLMLENFATNTSFINKIPYINLLVSIVSGFSPSRVESDWMESAAKGVKEIYKLMVGEGSGEKAFNYLLKALSDSTGIAGYNLYRDVRAFIELFN